MNERLKFPKSVRERWRVKLDGCRDEFIPVKGRRCTDFIYRISDTRVGLWLSSHQVKSRIKKLEGKIPKLQVEQLGDREAVVSVPMELLDKLCETAKARKKRQISPSERERLKRISPLTSKNPSQNQELKG